MRRFHYAAISAALILTGASPSTVWATSDYGQPIITDRSVKLAFTLDEMNCFSSDIRALEESHPTEAPDVTFDNKRIAQTNGIPCNARDPKAKKPPKKRSRS